MTKVFVEDRANVGTDCLLRPCWAVLKGQVAHPSPNSIGVYNKVMSMRQDSRLQSCNFLKGRRCTIWFARWQRNVTTEEVSALSFLLNALLNCATRRLTSSVGMSGRRVPMTATRAAKTAVYEGEATWDFIILWQKRPRPLNRFCSKGPACQPRFHDFGA